MNFDGAQVAIIHPGPPATCGGVMAAELTRHLRPRVTVEQVFVERRRKCRRLSWREPPDRIVSHWTKYLAFWQINARLPRYDLYHLLSERHARLLAYRRTPALATIHDLAPLRTDGIYTEGTRRRFHENLKTLLKAQAIVANTQRTRDDLIELFGVQEHRVEIIYPGVNSLVYAPRDKLEARRLLGLPAGAKIILNVGNENKNNNIPALVEVLSSLLADYPDIYLLRVGPTNPGVDEAIERFKVNTHVIRTGPDEGVTTLYNYYFNAADIHLCLDHYTGYSIQNLSAMASGCPVVSSARGAFPEIADGAATLVDPSDIDSVVDAVCKLLEDPDSSANLARRGLARAKQFKWEKAAKRYLEVYKKTLNGS